MAGFVIRCAAFLLFLPALAVAQSALPDPTRPAGAVPGAGTELEGGTQSLRLESVLISSTRRLAIINGEPYKVGQMVGEAKLMKISGNEVVLRRGGKNETLYLFQPLSKRK